MRKFLNLYRTNLFFALGITICTFWIFIALFAHQITPQDPLTQDIENRLQAPGESHWFGTDTLGRDVFSRVIVGSKMSIFAGLITVILAAIIGSIYGGIAGYVGGVVDDIMMRFAEMVLAFPALILAMTIGAVLGSSLYNTLFALVIVAWPTYARIMRSVVLIIKENDYIESARAIGSSNIRILTHQILPNALGSILIIATLDIGNQILFFSTLSFLGLGTPPPDPEWGAMISAGMMNFNSWWICTFPGLGILTMAVGANFIGDGVRDLLDPKLRKEFNT
ncbi:ABC transporter permease [Oceanispirochaeta sp.]|jgi:peptide/nickel transport system permease protein|uniref:ABC transporter permease n=1 Tax=Oceanispirochaeta sp. TaxID=2035350 RepID=UPI002602A92B|nr:ABC transporter permease [Oceanispirochaeta sp.]MDA3957281.1 ABC transporter permease [Oceanispirochaeta sp.]